MFFQLLDCPCLACENTAHAHIFCPFCLEYIESNSTFGPEKPGLFIYKGPIRKAILNIKLDRKSVHAFALLDFFQKHFQEHASKDLLKGFKPNAITCIPSHPFKRLWRGFDLPFLIAYTLSKQLHVPFVETLKTTGYFKPLSQIKSKTLRQKEVQKRFQTKPSKQLPQKLILVDDIYTSGATLKHCSQLLKKDGSEVHPFALAMTPL